MNNNRGNNRRRGRGNNRQQGGQQQNRVDSRARGNAPQMLEKYRKLAHDAHLNGDRVQEEYYLQFADHYFRVIADQRQRQEEQRQPRRDDRSQDEGRYQDDGRYPDDSRYPDDRDRNPYDVSDDDDAYGEERPAPAGIGRGVESASKARADAGPEAENDDDRFDDAGEPSPMYEPSDNPFLRDNRAMRAPASASRAAPRNPRRKAREEESDGTRADTRTEVRQEERPAARRTRSVRRTDDAPTSLDPMILPPSISGQESLGQESGDAPAGKSVEAAQDAPQNASKPRRRTRKAAPPSDDAGEALEVVN